jgi:SAM-dependent methyltransferase
MATIADQAVVRAQYENSANLGARQAIWRHGPSFVDIVLDLAQLSGDETVGDVGCGNGLFLAALRQRGHAGALVGLDLSAGMAGSTRADAFPVVADAQALHLVDGCFDRALCVHMLFHVPDIGRAVGELRRVVRTGGAAIVTTNGPGHIRELNAILAEATTQVTGIAPAGGGGWGTARFHPEPARRLLAQAFADVRLHDLGGSIPIYDAAVVSAAIASFPPEAVGQGAGPTWSAILAVTGELVAAHFATHGELLVTNGAAAFVCR